MWNVIRNSRKPKINVLNRSSILFCEYFLSTGKNLWMVRHKAFPVSLNESAKPRVDNHFETTARLITLPALHLHSLCCIPATVFGVGETKRSYLKPPSFSPAYSNALCDLQVYTDRACCPKCSHNNRSKWLNTQKRGSISKGARWVELLFA